MILGREFQDCNGYTERGNQSPCKRSIAFSHFFADPRNFRMYASNGRI